MNDELAPKILDELRERNPSNERANRKAKHHQFLTPSIGHPKLKEHLTVVMGIQRIAGGSWRKFRDMLNKAYPHYGHTLPILFSEFDKLLKGVSDVPPPKPEPKNKGDKDEGKQN